MDNLENPDWTLRFQNGQCEWVSFGSCAFWWMMRADTWSVDEFFGKKTIKLKFPTFWTSDTGTIMGYENLWDN